MCFKISITCETTSKIKTMNTTITENFICPYIIPSFQLLPPPSPHPQATTDLLSVTINLFAFSGVLNK